MSVLRAAKSRRAIDSLRKLGRGNSLAGCPVANRPQSTTEHDEARQTHAEVPQPRAWQIQQGAGPFCRVIAVVGIGMRYKRTHGISWPAFTVKLVATEAHVTAVAKGENVRAG
jgi:hypothetical protein